MLIPLLVNRSNLWATRHNAMQHFAFVMARARVSAQRSMDRIDAHDRAVGDGQSYKGRV
jgi:hypothetical protein